MKALLCAAPLAAACLMLQAAVPPSSAELSSRVELRRADLSPSTNMEVISSLIEFKPGSELPRHSHHGIESGYVLFDREIDGRANPRELGLERLVSDPGRTFGLSRKLVGLEFTDRPAHVEVPSAHVTSECDSPTLGKRIALSFAAPDAKPGDGVKLDDGRVARVAKLPFYDPGKHLPRAAPL